MIQNLLQIGEPVAHRGIVVAPLFPLRNPGADYVTLDEALPRGLRIAETSESGSVPELVVENPLAERVLLYDGEELLGAKQNRILNVSVLVEAKTSLAIPVSCVEQGRWSRRSAHFLAAPHISHAELRRRKAESQAAQPLARGVAQGEVWDAVRDKALRMEVHSATGASSDIHRAYERDIRALEDTFPAQPGAVRGAARDRGRPVPRRRFPAGCVRAAVAEAASGLPARRARAARREAGLAGGDRRLRGRRRRVAHDAAAVGRAR
jgi:hypothetical protein